MMLTSLCEQESKSCYISKLPISYYTLATCYPHFPLRWIPEYVFIKFSI